MNPRAEMLEYAQKEVEHVANTLHAAELLPDLPDYCLCYASGICFQIDIPYNLATLKELNDILVVAGWKEVHRFLRTNAGDVAVVFQHPDAKRHLEVMLQPDWNGATCTRKVIEKGVMAVYEIVCNEAPDV